MEGEEGNVRVNSVSRTLTGSRVVYRKIEDDFGKRATLNFILPNNTFAQR